MRFVRRGIAPLCLWIGLLPLSAGAQAPGADDAIDQIRKLDEIRALDQERIKEWVQREVDSLAALSGGNGRGSLDASPFKTFVARFASQYTHVSNTPPFREQFAAQTAGVAAAEYAKADLATTVAVSLARVLLDMNGVEVVSGQIAGLKASDSTARLLSASGLVQQRDVIRKEQSRLGAVIAALRAAGTVESDSRVLGRVYEALAYGNQVQPVLEAYLDIFDKRLAYRRGPAVVADGAELQAYEFFRTRTVVAALNPSQKKDLVSRLAVFLRLDAERYNDSTLVPPGDPKVPDLGYYERDRLERMLDAVEEILATLVGSSAAGGEIRKAFASGGYESRAVVLEQAYRWVGHPTTNQSGALGAAPWNVPIGAP